MSSQEKGNACLTEEEKKDQSDHFNEIIYSNLLTILKTRPKNPVSKFAKMILEEAGLDKNGDPLTDIE